MENERASRWTRSSICSALTITFLAISDAEEQNHQTIVFDLPDEPVIAHTIFPELPKPEPCSASPMLRRSSSLATRA